MRTVDISARNNIEERIVSLKSKKVATANELSLLKTRLMHSLNAHNESLIMGIIGYYQKLLQ